MKSKVVVLLIASLFLVSTSNSYAKGVALVYHHVATDTPASTSVTPEQFQQQLDYLSENQFKVIPLMTMLTKSKNKQPITDKSIAITFDDAYLSVYQNAWPLLKQKNYPFTLFVATDAIDQQYKNMMSWQQLKQMYDQGVTIANHSAAHDYMVRQSFSSEIERAEYYQHQIMEPYQQLTKQLGPIEKLFAYPYGEFDISLKQYLAQNRFYGIAQHSGAVASFSDWQAIPRFAVASDFAELSELSIKLNSLALPVSHSDPKDPVTQQTHPNLRLTLIAEQLESVNLAQLSCYFSGEKMQLTWLNSNKTQFEIRSKQGLPLGRSRYNCTAPDSSSNRYYWYSHFWLRLDNGH